MSRVGKNKNLSYNVLAFQVEDAEKFLTSAERQAVLLHLLYSLKETAAASLNLSVDLPPPLLPNQKEIEEKKILVLCILKVKFIYFDNKGICTAKKIWSCSQGLVIFLGTKISIYYKNHLEFTKMPFCFYSGRNPFIVPI